MENAPASWKKLEDVALTLEQINWIANVYDGLKPKEEKGEIESAAAVAIQRFKDTHKIENDKWVKKMKETDEDKTRALQLTQIAEDKETQQQVLLYIRDYISKNLEKPFKERYAAKYPTGNYVWTDEEGTYINWDMVPTIKSDISHWRARDLIVFKELMLDLFGNTEQNEKRSDDEWKAIGAALAMLMSNERNDFAHEVDKPTTAAIEWYLRNNSKLDPLVEEFVMKF